ncbi:centromere-associated protein E isoform X2 [Pristis pectinata]|uniref:centromere-associated protein E isoform X2 n=1 Tax=Pristis pectinata TaxID=685728 RepID=UPI00223E1671|nr:centromere-associated protein E isoform X2 [Pristis pectinata]
MAEEGAVQVCVRLRPPNARERSSQGSSEVHWKTDNQTISQINGAKSFNFDRVFHATETTQTVYNEVAHSIVCSITEGYNGTIFAYGQTSSGKTYTMMGNADGPGLIPLAICNLFKVINEMQNREFLLRVSYMEIYNESVSDLLSDSKGRPLEVREDMDRNIYVAELTEEVAVTYDAVMKWVKKGEKNRHYGETKMNERSSRSHTIFRVIVESRDKDNEAVMVAHLNLVDLAGSERASQTGAEGVRLKEGCNINRSLFVLGQVIKKLSDGQAGGFVNYRDSKLTRILQNSLGGNARTLIICTITPAAFEETLSTLQFASTAKFMKNTPHVNEVLDDQAMLKRYLKEIAGLKDKLEALTSETRVHEIEKAQLLSEKHHLQQEHEQKIKNLTRMLVRASSDDDQLDTKARRKRRFTWAPGKVQVSLNFATDNAAKIIKLDQAFQELDEIPEEFLDDQQSDMMSGCSSQITVRRGGSCGYQIPSFEDSPHFNDQSRLSQTSLTSILYDGSPKDESEKRISELEQELEDLTKEKEKQIIQLKNDAKHLEKQLKGSVELCELLYSQKSDAESLKMENEKHKEEIRELKQLLEEKRRSEKYLRMENEKQNNEIQELKLRDGYEERREIEEFEFLEKEVEKEEKAQQKHEIATLKELVRNSEVFNQELEAELKTKTKQLKDQEQSCLVLQQRLDQLKELSDGQMDLETLMIQIKQLQQSLNDAEVVTCDAKKESAFLRSENLELKETMNEKMVKYQQMEKDVQLYCKKLDTEQSRYKQMQSDLQKELKSVYSENAKLMSLLDGKVPKDILDRVYLEKSITDLNQQLEKAEKENISLRQEVAVLSQNKLLPQKIDELEKQVLKLTNELNGVTCERDNLLAGKFENDEQLINLRGEVLLIAQERDKLQEEVNSLQYERDHQDNLKAEQQNEVQCRVESLKLELELYCTQLEEERAKCSQLQHNVEGKEGQVKELEQQLELELVKQKEINDKFSKASEDIKLLNEVKEELITKLQVLTKANEELTMSQPKSQKCIENQAELRSLHDKLKLNQNVEVELKKSLAEKECLINEEKKKSMQASEALDLAQEELRYQQQLVNELRNEIQEKKDLLLSFQENVPERADDKVQELTEHLKNVVSQPDLEDEMQEPCVHSLGKQNTNIHEEFNQCVQQREDEKSMKENNEVEVILQDAKIQKNEIKRALEENTEMQNQADELCCLVTQRDTLLAEIEELRARASKELETVIQKEEFSQQFQQLENEKLNLLKEKDEFLETLKCIKAEKDEMKRALEEKTEETQKQGEELHHAVSQRDTLLAEIEELRDRVFKEQEAEIREEEFNQQFQQLEDEKSSLIKERDELLEKFRCIEVEKDEMKRKLQENAEVMQKQTEELHHLNSQHDVLLDEIDKLRAHVSKEQEAVIHDDEFNQRFQQLEDEKSSLVKEKAELQETLKCIKAEKDEMKIVLQENSEVTQKQGEELHHVVSQRDVLLAEIEGLRARVLKEKDIEMQEKEFSQRFQQLEDEKSSLVKERVELQKTLKCIKAEQDEMTRALQEKTDMMQKQDEELGRMVSQCDVLLVEVEELRAHTSKVPKAEIQEEEFNQQLQQLANEKLSIVKEKQELKAKLKNIKAERDEMEKTLQENNEMMQKQRDELHQVISQRDRLLAETEELRDRASKEQKAEIQEVEFNQRLQQLEDEKSSIMKERNDLQESLACIKIESDEMKSTLQEKLQEQAEELHQLVSQRDLLLNDIEELRTHASKEQRLEILEEKFNQHVQQLEVEKSAIVKEKDELQEMLERIQVQKDEMKRTLQENTEANQVQAKELNSMVSQRDMLLDEIKELRTLVSKEQNTHILEEKFNQQLQQLEDEKSAIVKEMVELQEKLECVKVERDEMKRALKESTQLKMEERRNKELTELVTSLEKQIVALKEQTQIETTTPENKENEAEINKLSNYLQEKDLLLQETIKSLFRLENEYKIELAKTDQQLSREGEEWNELLVKFCSKFPEESMEAISIKKLQEENQKLYEKLVLWRSHFMRALSTVPQNVKKYQIPITKCDLGLADEKKKNEELCIQLQTLKKQVSDSPVLELTSQEKNPEILRLSTLIEFKENHLMNTQQTLSELKLKYQNYLRSTKDGLSSKAKAQEVFKERVSVVSPTNALKIIEEIEHEMRMLNQDLQLQNEAVQNEATFSKSVQTGYVKYIRNSCNEMANQKKKNDELLLEIETFRQQSFNKNGCDPILAMENQKLKKKMKTDEQLLQTMEMKIQELELALTTSQETNKLQEDKVTQLQTELSSKTENKLEDLQATLLKKDNQINSMEEALKQLQAKLDMGAQPFREEMHELKNRLFILEMEKVKESKNLENQISSLKASLEHKEELMRQTKETLRRYQQKQDTTIMVENNNEICSTDTSLTCSAGSGIVQNALLLVLRSEKAKLNQDLNRLKKENARLARTVSELKYENTRWKDRALKLKEKERESSEYQRENVPRTLTPSLEEGITPCSVTEHATVPQKVESSELLPSEFKTGAKLDETSLTSEKMLPVDSSKVSSFGTESKWLLPRSKIFDNSQLGFPAAESPQRKPKSDENEYDDWWPKPSDSDPQCKVQ